MKPVRTRIAPSPTGYLHIGNLRTILYDLFLAHQSGGQFIVRIEDTDQERLVDDALERVIKVFQRLGIEYDEGPILQADGSITQKGNFGPYIQSERLGLYKPYVQQLIDAGHAYHCFCTHERLEKMREEQSALKQAPKYDRLCLTLSQEEVQAKLAAGESYVIRMKIPDGSSEFVDAIRGKIIFQNAEVDDQVLMKSDGFPTYHLAVVIDDHLMEITHVLRGEEWISSTPKQIILHQMFGWEMPTYAHVPLILNPDKTKLSKRKGDVSVESFLQKGYLPEALMNFLALLGWNPTSDREIFTKEELVKMFDLSKVNKAGAVMNMEKLNWLNGQYLKSMSETDYLALCRPWLEGHITGSMEHGASSDVDRAALMVRERLQVLNELPELVRFLFEEKLNHDPSVLPWKTQSIDEVRERLSGVRDWLLERPADQFSSIAEMEKDLRAFIVSKGWGNGDTLWPLRVALSGQKQSPGPFEMIFAYGKERTLARIDEALAHLA